MRHVVPSMKTRLHVTGVPGELEVSMRKGGGGVGYKGGSRPAAIAGVNAAIEKSQFGDKQAILLRNTKMGALKVLLRSLAAYVSIEAQGDPK